MKEGPFQNWVIATAETFGWRVWHVPMPARQIGGGKLVPEPRGRGLLDLWMLHDSPPRLIIAELKGTDGQLTDEQREFLSLAGGVQEEIAYLAGEDPTFPQIPLAVFAWWPHDRDVIETILRSKVLA